MVEKVFIKNSKGLRLAAIIDYPDKKRKYPTMMILHGFTGCKEEPHLERLAKTLSRNGFTAVRFDASGLGESDGAFAKDYSMSNYLEDIGCAYDYIKELEFVDKDRIGIVGHSMGGILSVAFASEHPEIKACIAISPSVTLSSTNWIKAAVEEWRKVGWVIHKMVKDKHVKIPFSFAIDSNKFNILDLVQKMHCSFLTILGLSDNVVSPDNTKKIFKAANEPKELTEIEGIGHHYKDFPEQVEIVNKKILNFLKKHL